MKCCAHASGVVDARRDDVKLCCLFLCNSLRREFVPKRSLSSLYTPQASLYALTFQMNSGTRFQKARDPKSQPSCRHPGKWQPLLFLAIPFGISSKNKARVLKELP